MDFETQGPCNTRLPENVCGIGDCTFNFVHLQYGKQHAAASMLSVSKVLI
ncbi:UNVERIFIED_CONTAM: hypothetical protein FKN15_027920 [Acipenser sinensis]